MTGLGRPIMTTKGMIMVTDYDEEDVRKSIMYHYRRGYSLMEATDNSPDFNVVMEKNGVIRKVGVEFGEGVPLTPKQIYKLMEEGWTILIVQSCYKWDWETYRYTGDWGRSDSEDIYGRARIFVMYYGYYDKVDVFKGGQKRSYSSKNAHSSEDDVKNYFDTIPEEVRELLDKTEWLEEEENEKVS
jgi:hypothetical protein